MGHRPALEPEQRICPRPRLVRLLHERWRRPVVTLVGGPGFGKSTALMQAVRENELGGDGVDVVIECRRQRPSPRLLTELAQRWPRGACLVLDDVHHLTASADGRRLVTQLVSDLPPSVHLVLAGRHPVPGLAARRAAGDVVDLTEADLALDAGEEGELADRCGADVDAVRAAGGWPAMAAVAATLGSVAADEYARETVIDRLRDDDCHLLALGAALGRADARLLAGVAGTDALERLAILGDVPLVTVAGDHVAVPSLWRRVLAGRVDTDRLHAAIGRAVAVLTEGGEHERAYALCVAERRWDDAASVVSSCCRRGIADIPSSVAAAWFDTLPAPCQDEPAGLLLRGLVARLSEPFAATTIDVLRRAADAYRSTDDVGGEVAAITELAYVLRNQGRCDELGTLLARAAELHAAGRPEAAAWMAMARSIVSELAGDDAGMLAELDTVPAADFGGPWRAVVAFRRAIGSLALGRDHDARAAATAAVAAADQSTMRHILALVEWFAGDAQPALARADELVADGGRSAVDGVALGSFATMVLATAGRLDEAAQSLAATERAAARGPVSVRMTGYVIGVRALLAAAKGDDDEARAVLTAALAERPLASPLGRQAAAFWLALAYVLVPAVRAELDGAPLGPIHARRIEVARAVVAARAGRSGPITARGAALDPELVATTVPLPWAATLASRLPDSDGQHLVATLYERYGLAARAALRTVEGRADGGARKLLAAVTPPAPAVVRLDLLGPTALWRDGVACRQAEWQRERVRALLAYLAVRGPARRAQITDAVWPELDAAAGDRNLRVTLTYLQRILEPGRQAGEAPHFLDQDGGLLVLRCSSSLWIDAAEFEAQIASARRAESDGLLTQARDHLDDAVAIWRGPCLGEFVDEDWAQATSLRLTDAFLSAALRAAELHLAAGATGSTRHLAHRALEADPWSERAHRLLVEASVVDGDHAAALGAMARCEAVLAELGVAPAPETLDLRRRLRAPAGIAGLSAAAS